MYSFTFSDHLGDIHIFIHEFEPLWALPSAAWISESISVSAFVLIVTTEN